MLGRRGGGEPVIESKQDPELAELGAAPGDLRTIMTRTLGDRPVTLSYADELLEALTRGVDALDPQPGEASAEPAAGAFGPARRSPVPLAPSTPPVFVAAPPPPVDVPPVFDARPLASSAPPPLFNARSVAVEPPKVFDAPREPDPEATAQAIQAAFDEPEPDPLGADAGHDTLDSAPPPGLLMSPAPSLELDRARRERGGARRPDLDHLLNQPLDALDFERSEPLTKPALGGYSRSDTLEAPVPPAAAAPADDFEILVDDEILEIGEDDVELVDDEHGR